MMETNARWNFDTDRIGSDRIAIERRGRLEEDIRFLSIDRSAPFGRTRSIRARCNRRRQCVLRTRTRFAWRSACLRCAAQILVGGSHFVHHCVKWIGWRKKSYRTYPLTRYRFHVQPSLCFYLFIYLFIYPFILFIFFFCQTFPLTRPFHFFNERADRWKFSKIHGFLVKRESGFESPRRRRPRSRESSSIRTKNLSLSLSLAARRHFRQKESHRIFHPLFLITHLTLCRLSNLARSNFHQPALLLFLLFHRFDRGENGEKHDAMRSR